jgi:hypothetical protein
MKNFSISILSIFLSTVLSAQPLNNLWQKQLGDGSGGSDELRKFCTDSRGNLIAVGLVVGTHDFDRTEKEAVFTSVGNSDIYIAKYNSFDELIWVKLLRTDTESDITGVGTDSNDNIYITGYFDREISLDPNDPRKSVYQAGSNELLSFTAKYDSSGALIWSHIFGNGGDIRFKDIAVDKAGNFYTAGDVQGIVDLDPSNNELLIEGKNNDITPFLAKYDSSGELLWAFGLEGGFTTCLTLSDNDDIYMAGHLEGDIDPSSANFTLQTYGRFDIGVAAYTSNGSFKNAMAIGGSFNEGVEDMKIDHSKNLYITGRFDGMVDFDPSSNVERHSGNGFVAKYDKNFNFKWVVPLNMGPTQTSGAQEIPGIYGLDLDKNGNCYINGNITTEVDFDPSVNSKVLKGYKFTNTVVDASYDSLGNLNWAHQANGGLRCLSNDVIIRSNSVYSGGIFGQSISFGESGTKLRFDTDDGNGRSSFFVKRSILDGEPTDAWVIKDHQGRQETYVGLATLSNGDIINAGNFSGKIDFNAGRSAHYLSMNGGSNSTNIFIKRENENGELTWVKTLGNSADQKIISMDVDNKNNIWILGTFEDSLDVDPSFKNTTLMGNAINDIFLAKYDENGNYITSFTLGEPLMREELFEMKIDKNDNVWICGAISKELDVDPSNNVATVGEAGKESFFISKYNSEGEYLQSASNQLFSSGIHNMTISGNSLFLSAKIPIDERNMNFKTGDPKIISTATQNNVFIAKYNLDLDYKWMIEYKTNSSFYWLPNKLSVDDRGGLYVMGDYFKVLALPDTILFSESEACFLAKFGRGGKLHWVQNFSNTTSDARLYSSAIQASNGQVYAMGNFSADLIINGKDTITDNDVDATFLARFDRLGKLELLKTFSSQMNVTHIAQNNRSIYISSQFSNAADFSLEDLKPQEILYAKGNVDLALLKLGTLASCSETKTNIEVTQCENYISPSGRTYRQGGVYFDSLFGFWGCDSIIEIDFDKPSINTSINVEEGKMTVGEENALY